MPEVNLDGAAVSARTTSATAASTTGNVSAWDS